MRRPFIAAFSHAPHNVEKPHRIRRGFPVCAGLRQL